MANLQALRRNSIAWVLFGLRGRVSRHVYWLSWILLVCLNGVLIGQLFGGEDASLYRVAQAAGPFFILATLYSNVAITVKRLHDIGYSGFLAVAIFIPIVNIAFSLWVGLVPGAAGPNGYGDQPDLIPE